MWQEDRDASRSGDWGGGHWYRLTETLVGGVSLGVWVVGVFRMHYFILHQKVSTLLPNWFRWDVLRLHVKCRFPRARQAQMWRLVVRSTCPRHHLSGPNWFCGAVMGQDPPQRGAPAHQWNRDTAKPYGASLPIKLLNSGAIMIALEQICEWCRRSPFFRMVPGRNIPISNQLKAVLGNGMGPCVDSYDYDIHFPLCSSHFIPNNSNRPKLQNCKHFLHLLTSIQYCKLLSWWYAATLPSVAFVAALSLSFSLSLSSLSLSLSLSFY